MLKHRNLLAHRSGNGTQNGVEIRTPRKTWVGSSKTKVPAEAYIPRDNMLLLRLSVILKIADGDFCLFNVSVTLAIVIL